MPPPPFLFLRLFPTFVSQMLEVSKGAVITCQIGTDFLKKCIVHVELNNTSYLILYPKNNDMGESCAQSPLYISPCMGRGTCVCSKLNIIVLFCIIYSYHCTTGACFIIFFSIPLIILVVWKKNYETSACALYYKLHI